MTVSREAVKKYEEYLGTLIREELYGTIQDNRDVSKDEGGGTQLSCEDVKKIYGTVYWVIGDNLIQYIKSIESQIKHPTIYFKSGECEDMLKDMGITEPGVYMVKNGQLVRKIKKFDYWFKKHLLSL